MAPLRNISIFYHKPKYSKLQDLLLNASHIQKWKNNSILPTAIQGTFLAFKQCKAVDRLLILLIKRAAEETKRRSILCCAQLR